MTSDKPRAKPIQRKPRAEVFRRAIEIAEGEGLARADMVLHLTLRDAHQLKADPGIPISDISFAGGAMQFLGVPVVQGGAPVSFLGGEGLTDIPFTA
jgi:hypothetical protein